MKGTNDEIGTCGSDGHSEGSFCHPQGTVADLWQFCAVIAWAQWVRGVAAIQFWPILGLWLTWYGVTVFHSALPWSEGSHAKWIVLPLSEDVFITRSSSVARPILHWRLSPQLFPPFIYSPCKEPPPHATLGDPSSVVRGRFTGLYGFYGLCHIIKFLITHHILVISHSLVHTFSDGFIRLGYYAGYACTQTLIYDPLSGSKLE